MSPRERKPLDLATYEGCFADRLKKLREKAGLTAGKVAEELGVTDQCIYDWEAARRQPKISDLPKIAKILGLKKTRDVLPNK